MESSFIALLFALLLSGTKKRGVKLITYESSPVFWRKDALASSGCTYNGSGGSGSSPRRIREKLSSFPLPPPPRKSKRDRLCHFCQPFKPAGRCHSSSGFALASLAFSSTRCDVTAAEAVAPKWFQPVAVPAGRRRRRRKPPAAFLVLVFFFCVSGGSSSTGALARPLQSGLLVVLHSRHLLRRLCCFQGRGHFASSYKMSRWNAMQTYF